MNSNVNSTKSVGGTQTTKADPDNDSAAKAAEKQAQLDKIRADADARAKAEAAKQAAEAEAAEAAKQAEFEKALAENDSALSAEQQRLIDAEMGDHSEAPDDEDDEAPKQDGSLIGRLNDFCEVHGTPKHVIMKLVREVAADTPDEHSLWGIPGAVLRMGHLRALVVGIVGKD